LSSVINKAIVQHLRGQVSLKYPQAQARWDEYIPLPTGILPLDQGLLKGGLPRGHLIEILGSRSSGKTTLLFHMLSALSEEERKNAYFDFSGTFYPLSAQKSGTDLKKLLVLRPENIQAGLRAAEIFFRSGGILVSVFDLVGTHNRIPKALLLRLRKSIRQAQGLGIFLREPDSSRIEGNQLALCLKVEKRSQKLLVKTEKGQLGNRTQEVELALNG
jgi:energy-coupling factor transporter ATP-binding protein EcfA2